MYEPISAQLLPTDWSLEDEEAIEVGWTMRSHRGVGMWRQHLAKIQTVIARLCLSGARPEYLPHFSRTIWTLFLLRSASSLILFFCGLSWTACSCGSECIASEMVKYLVAIYIAKKCASLRQSRAFEYCLKGAVKDSGVSKRLKSLQTNCLRDVL